MRGYGGYARLAKDAGNWLWEAAVNFRNPGFETNDYSFLTSADYIWNNANIVRSWQKPTKWYRTFILLAGGQLEHNFDGNVTSNTQAQVYAGGTTPNFWQWSRLLHLAAQRLDRRPPPARRTVREDERLRLHLAAGVDGLAQAVAVQQRTRRSTTTTNGGWGSTVDLTATFQPSTRMFISFGPSYNNSQRCAAVRSRRRRSRRDGIQWHTLRAVEHPAETARASTRAST